MSKSEKPDDNWSKKPNLLEHLGLSPGEYRLYGRILAETLCGQKPYTEDERTGAKAIGVSPNTFRKWKHRLAAPFDGLCGKPLIRILKTQSKKNPLRKVDHLEVVDIWPEHRTFFKEKARAKRRLRVGLTTGLTQAKPNCVASKSAATRPQKLTLSEDALLENKEHSPRRHTGKPGAPPSFSDFEGLKKLGYDDDEAEVLAEFNRRAPLDGFKLVDRHTKEVCRALRGNGHGDVMTLEELADTMDKAKESGPPKLGDKTFVRMVFNSGK
jgi:hypothetical protein